MRVIHPWRGLSSCIGARSFYAFDVIVYISIPSGQTPACRRSDGYESIDRKIGHEHFAIFSGVEFPDVIGCSAGGGAIYLHHELLHQQPERIVSNSAGMAGGHERDTPPSPVALPPRRNRLEQWRTDHDLHRPGGIRYRVSELRRSEQSVATVSSGLRAADVCHRRRMAQSQGLSLRNAERSACRRTRWNMRSIFQSSWSSDELVGVRAQGA